jgi:hypothetical protein
MKAMMSEDLKDYAYPTMMAEKALKKLHLGVIHGDMDGAREEAYAAVRWMLEIIESLRVMDAKAKG